MYGFAREAEQTHSGRLKLTPALAGAAQAPQRCNIYELVNRALPNRSPDYAFFFHFFSFAFVDFESTDDAKEALENLNNTDIEGRTIRLEYSQQNNRGNDGGRGNSGRTSFLKK